MDCFLLHLYCWYVRVCVCVCLCLCVCVGCVGVFKLATSLNGKQTQVGCVSRRGLMDACRGIEMNDNGGMNDRWCRPTDKGASYIHVCMYRQIDNTIL